MKKILFDLSVCQPNGDSKFHGGGIYGIIVFKACMKIFSRQEIIIYLDTSKFIDPSVTEIIVKSDIEVIDGHFESLEKAIKHRNDISLLYSPLFRQAYNMIKSVPVLVTIHGLRALEMNRDRYEILYKNSFSGKLKALLKQTPLYIFIEKKYWNSYKGIFNGSNISYITVSQHSKYSIISHYPHVEADKVTVLYSPSTTETDVNKVDVYAEEPYFLIISANRWIKNSYRALMALDELYSNDTISIKTIVCGITIKSDIASKLKNKDKFSFLEYVDRDVLESLYKGAFALIYPSLNEGFGYPPLEAMKYGTPVLSSSFASISEICGDAVIYFNPYSVKEIQNRILMISSDKTIYDYYSSKGHLRYKNIKDKQDSDLQRLIDIFKSNVAI